MIWLVCEPTSAGMHWACTRWLFPLSCVTLRPSWSHSRHWFILFIMPGINLTLHPCHSRNSIYFEMFRRENNGSFRLRGAQGLKMCPIETFCSGCWVKLKHSMRGNVVRRKKKKKDQQSSFHFPRLLSLAVASLTSCPHSSTRAGLLISGFNETGYCHSHIWA